MNRRNKYGFTALILASFTGPTILAMPGRSTELSIQASDGQVEMVKLLLNAGADPNASTDDGFTPLMAASGEGYIEIVRLLLQSGADVTAKNKRGSTPFSLACNENHCEVIELLVSHTLCHRGLQGQSQRRSSEREAENKNGERRRADA